MSSERPSPELTAVTTALHEVFCEQGAKPGAVWSDSHRRSDRRTGERFLGLLHVGGWQVSRAEVVGVARLAEDFMSTR